MNIHEFELALHTILHYYRPMALVEDEGMKVYSFVYCSLGYEISSLVTECNRIFSALQMMM